MDDIPLSALLSVFFVMLLLSAVFSSAEPAMMSLNRYRLKHLVKQGNRGARMASALLDKTDRLLGIILLCNTFLNTFATALGTLIAVRMLGEQEWVLSIATVTISFFILIIGEITPKVLGATYPEQCSFFVSYLLTPLLRVFYPVVWFVNLFVRALLWAARLQPKEHGQASRLSMAELRTLVLEGSHYIPPQHQSVLANLFALENTTVADVMTPRNQLEAIDLDAPEEAIREQVVTSHHSRLLVYREKLDNIIGVVTVRKLLHRIHNGEINAEALEEAMREPYFIPAGTSLLSQMQLFQENQRRTGMVVDEYGELLGMVSLDDILEEIVGEFTTVAPGQLGAYRRQEDGGWLVDGASQLRDLNRKLKLEFPLDGPKTLNGLILEHFEDIPEAGTSFKLAGHTMEILQTQDRAVKVVRIFPAPPAPAQ